MKPTVAHLRAIAKGKPDEANMRSIIAGLDSLGQAHALHQPHVLAQYLAQLAGETGGFRYDREIWGPTAAQQRYDTRTDLGNSPERDGDGERYRGRAGIQITGKANYLQFFEWCRARGLNPPDFVAHPDLVNADPWEGLAPIWYWETRGLSAYANQNDIETIRKRINGGLNGFDAVLEYYSRAALVLLGYGWNANGFDAAIRDFQAKAMETGTYPGPIDGDAGPKTRAALHMALLALGALKENRDIRAAPVVTEIPVPVAPAKTEKPGTDILTLIMSGAGSAIAAFAGLDWRVQLAIFGFAALGLVLVATGRWNLAKGARELRQALEPRQ